MALNVKPVRTEQLKRGNFSTSVEERFSRRFLVQPWSLGLIVA